ncbi:MAG: hypothetical protein HGA29_02025 [Syntrophaceae bacterium]|nr:hypothetical protein [Syntrophaceae bacterium]
MLAFSARCPPLAGVQGVDIFDAIVILIGYGLEVLDPPPSLRDTSASGGH